MKKQNQQFLLLFIPLFLIVSSFTLKNNSLYASLEKKVYFTKRISENLTSPIIDGKLDEKIWNNVDWATSFTQRSPNEGEDPSEETSFKVLYDEENLYLAFRAHDNSPDDISTRMSRRDGFNGDWVEVNIDSYHDLRTAFSFTACASGVKGDEAITNDGNNWDGNWDPVWDFKTSIDEKGWTAEVKIPFSQLRFSDSSEEQVWGIQVQRNLFRKGERSFWQEMPRDGTGWVSRFGELHGIKNIKSNQQFEILPYSVSSLNTYEKIDNDPYNEGNDFDYKFGVDGKYALTTDLTVDFTINPDFGQVEADPSEVNLSAFESYQRERRPFFIEGRNILEYDVTSAQWSDYYGMDNLFYSRRIGRTPHSYVYSDSGDSLYASNPENTKILGAVKLTGKTSSGLAIGILESVTAEENAEISDLSYGGEKYDERVEPMTNYFVGRLQQDYNGGKTIFGGIFTSVNREQIGSDFDYLHKGAYSAGFDFIHRFMKRKYYLSANVVASHVTGDSTSIQDTQLSSTHYFQRPNKDYAKYKSDKTSLTGHGGTISFGKSSEGNIRFQSGVTCIK